MAGPYEKELDKRIEKMKTEGVTDMKLYPVSPDKTREDIARGVLALLDAPTVEDPEFF